MTHLISPRRRFGAAALAASMAIVLAACSGAAAVPTVPPALASAAASAAAALTFPPVPALTSAPGNQGDSTDPACALVTKDQVATAAGFSIATAIGAGGTCIYQNTDPSKLMGVVLFTNQAGMASMLQIEGSAAHVDGLGDDAFWVGVGGILFVRKGDRGVEFYAPSYTMTADTNTGPRDLMVTLAKSALPHL